MAEALEGRPVTKGNSEDMAASCTQRQGEALTKLNRIREAAHRDKNLRFTTLMHHITTELLRNAYMALKRNAAPGIDEMTWRQYGKELEANLTNLHQSVQSGRYRAQPSKRIWLPKPDGRQRPIGIAALEDKIVQQAVVWILNQIYEEDFMGFSYGFRPGRSQHNALDALWVGITRRKVNWVLDADIRSFFDTIDHEWMMKFMEHRIADQRLLRLIRKWLRAGVSEDGQWSKTTVGTPQGAVISPILANIYLHYVLDLWAHQWRTKHAAGEVIIVRYADDVVMGFQHRKEAERFLQELGERMAKFGLELHSEKTRLIEFGRFAAENRAVRGEGKPETFDFLGFTHICGRTRKGDRFTVRRKTIAKRLQGKVKAVREEIIRRRHDPIPEQGKWLRAVVQGHFNYFAVPGNKPAIDAFRTEVIKAWLHALRRRSQKARNLTWERIKRLVATWIPSARILHPYPSERLRVTNPR
ncbi:MAG: group II intron reverse transcriptase/maturase [Syntrophomonadales bacterium]|jgi:RNA-directed DNA polymerase